MKIEVKKIHSQYRRHKKRNENRQNEMSHEPLITQNEMKHKMIEIKKRKINKVS